MASAREKHAAHLTVHAAVLTGHLPPVTSVPCADCGGRAVNYHHADGYATAQLLTVVALCRSCHSLRHVGERPPNRRASPQQRSPHRAVLVRFPPDAAIALEAALKQERRSVTAQVVWLVKQWLAQRATKGTG